MTEETARIIKAEIEKKIPLCHVEVEVLRKLQPVPYIKKDSGLSKKEVYVIRTVDSWMIVIEYNPTNHECVATVEATNRIK